MTTLQDPHFGQPTLRRPKGHAPNYPIIGDANFNVAKQYGMGCYRPAPPATPLRAPRRQPDGAERVRDRPGQEDQADPGLPDDHWAQFRRGAAGDRLRAADRDTPGGHAGELEAGGGRYGVDHQRRRYRCGARAQGGWDIGPARNWSRGSRRPSPAVAAPAWHGSSLVTRTSPSSLAGIASGPDQLSGIAHDDFAPLRGGPSWQGERPGQPWPAAWWPHVIAGCQHP